MTKCALCGTGVNPLDSHVGQRVQGWEVKATAASRKSGSDVIGREQLQEFACGSCLHRVRLKLSPQQGAMLV